MHAVQNISLLVFSKCFHTGFLAFSTFKYRAKGGTNSCKWRAILKLKSYLIFISGVVVNSVSLLTDRRLKGLR